MTREQTIKEIRTHVKNIRHIIGAPCGWLNVNDMQITFLSTNDKPHVKIEFDKEIMYIWSIDNENCKNNILFSIAYRDIKKIF